MSNTRRARWTEAEVTAATVEAELDRYISGLEADAARKLIVRRLGAELLERGHPPGLVATMEQCAHGLGDDWWSLIYQAIVTADER